MEAKSTPGSKRGPYSSPRQRARQQRILETARREISTAGYDALTMQQLASACEVSTKTLYNLYGSKDELLLAAVADLFGNLEQHPRVLAAAPGVAALLAFTEVIFDQVLETPRYADAMARTLFRADPSHRLVDVLLGSSQRATLRALTAARQEGQLEPHADIDDLARRLTAHQWGLILLWSKGLLALDGLRAQALRSQVDNLLPVCRGKARRWLARY